METGEATEPTMLKVFGPQVAEIMSSLKDLKLVEHIQTSRDDFWRPRKVYFLPRTKSY